MAVYGKGKLDFASIAADAFGNALGNGLMESRITYSEDEAKADTERELKRLQSRTPETESTPWTGQGLRPSARSWDAFNEGLTHTINANQQARQGTAPEGNPVLSQAIHGPGITDSSSEAELLNYQYQLSGLGGEYALQPMSGGASKRVRLEMSLEDQLTAHKQRLQYLREIEAEQSSEWRDMNASEAARLAAKRSTPDSTPEWIQEGQASSAGFYAGLKDRAVENGGLSGFGLYYGAHIGGLLADTGYHLTRSGYGAYQLLTDSQARSDAWNNMSYALTHPGEVVSGLQRGLSDWLAKPFGQQADDLFQLGTTALAGGVVGRLKVPGGVGNSVRTGDALRYEQYWDDLGIKPASLNDRSARAWYLSEEMKIPSMLDSSASLEVQAKASFEIRNRIRSQARDLMEDQVHANFLRQTEPNLTWNELVTIKSLKYSGDDLWRSIITSSQKSRASVNAQFGFIGDR